MVESHSLFLIGLHVLKNGAVSTLLSGNCEILCSTSHPSGSSLFPFCIFLESPITPNNFLSVSLSLPCCAHGWVNTEDTLAFLNVQYLTLSSCETLTITLEFVCHVTSYWSIKTPDFQIAWVLKLPGNHATDLVLRWQNKYLVKDATTVEA